ncbi:MAG: hypothetical protein QME81_05835 [bacterium]|nr:hypothetical protein [bacterium]
MFNDFGFRILHSAIRNLQSAIRNPQSAIQNWFGCGRRPRYAIYYNRFFFMSIKIFRKRSGIRFQVSAFKRVSVSYVEKQAESSYSLIA